MGVEDKEQRPKNRALGNTKAKPLGLRGNVVYSEGREPVSNVEAYPLEGKICNTKSGAEALQQYVMIYRVEGGG